MESSNFENVGEEKKDLKQLTFAFCDSVTADPDQITQSTETAAPTEADSPEPQKPELPMIASAEEPPAQADPTVGSIDAPVVAELSEAIPAEATSTAEPQVPAKQSAVPSGDVNKDKPRLFAKRKKKEPLASAAARVHNRMIQQATGLETPPDPPIGYWVLSASYSELGKATKVCKRNMQRVFKLLKETKKVIVEKEPTFKNGGVYKVIPEKQITTQVLQ